MSIRDWLIKMFGDAFKKAVKTVPVIPDIIKPPVADKPATVIPGNIPPISGRYSDPKARMVNGRMTADEYGNEIWISNWHRMNIRIHANPGEFRAEKIPASGIWYPIKTDFMPAGTVTMEKTADGCVLTAKDFTSSNGQAYRFEGWKCDGLGPRNAPMVRQYSVVLKDSQMHGACFAWYATVGAR